ncbi:MAG: S41 family peptidase [Firmicutes bacterium]|nr:S41 family peptidase [Bacillota bacterium]
MKSLVGRIRALAGALLIAVVSGLGGVYVGQSGLVPPDLVERMGLPVFGPGAGHRGPEWEQLEQVFHTIRDRYVQPVDEATLVKGAIRGMVEATGDKYSMYMDAQEYAAFLRHFEPSFTGIGVVVGIKDNYVTIIRPIRGTPGERAGLRTGDRILAVDGKDVTRMSVDEVANLIRGPKGTKVRLRISRPPYTDSFEVEIERAEIQPPYTEGKMLEWAPGVGYIRIEEFNTNVSQQVARQLAELRAKGMKGLVLDLRQNPGGLLTEAVKTASLFLGPGPIVHVVDREGNRETHSSTGQRDFDLPLVVLIDGGSASASEIVAGALRDRGVATLVGTRTFGKGSVQSFYNLDGGAGLKLTTHQYLTAGGHSIHQVGIQPDVVVEAPPPEPGAEPVPPDDPRDPQLRRAVEILKSKMR